MTTFLLISLPILVILTWLAAYQVYARRDFFIVRLVRHGESKSNTGEEDFQKIGDHNVRLTPKGMDQAFQLGQKIGYSRLKKALIYHSPYRRTKQTRKQMLLGAGFTEAEIAAFPSFEDLLIREVEFGYGDLDAQLAYRNIHGYFYYRFDGGESPAGAYDRITGFIENLWSQVKRKFRYEFFRRILCLEPREIFIVGHGLAHRLFVMRWLHLTVDQFDTLDNPRNCDVITIAPVKWLDNPQFICGRWGVTGLRFRKEARKVLER